MPQQPSNPKPNAPSEQGHAAAIDRTLDPLAGIEPTVFRPRVERFVAACAAKGVPIRVVSGYRSYDEQAALYAQGRTRPGSVVTNARPGSSWHNHGFAVDVIPKAGGYDAPLAVFRAIAEIARACKLAWGGDWVSFRDLPHFQPVELHASPSANAVATLKAGGPAAVWKLANLSA